MKHLKDYSINWVLPAPSKIYYTFLVRQHKLLKSWNEVLLYTLPGVNLYKLSISSPIKLLQWNMSVLLGKTYTDLSKIHHPASERESFLALHLYHLLKDKGRLKYSVSHDKTCCWLFRTCFYAHSILFYGSRSYFLWHTYWLVCLDLCGNKESLSLQSISWLIAKCSQSISWLITKCKLKH